MRISEALTISLALGLAACGGLGKDKGVAADSAGRDLQMSQPSGDAALNDRPATGGAPSSTAPAPRPAPKPAAPVAPAARELAAGTTIHATARDTITSRHNKAGETLTATVPADVKNAKGQVVIPAGSTLRLTIVELAPAENKGQKDGKLVLRPESVEIGGKTYAVVGTVGSVEHFLKGRGVTGGDVAKVGAGTAAGAVVGGLVGKTKGAVIGGVVGAAAGTAVAVETADRDVVVPAGAAIEVVLGETLAVRK